MISPVAAGPGTVFALVAYIPGELGAFLNSLRPRLVPSCHLLSHLTILPPRATNAQEDTLVRFLDRATSRVAAFEVELGDVEIFPVTNVIYLSVLAGRGAVESIHEDLNHADLAFDEPFEFQPHITLAQDVEPERLLAVYELARQVWADCPHQDSFSVEKLTFVRNDGLDVWSTVSEHQLACSTLLRTV